MTATLATTLTTGLSGCAPRREPEEWRPAEPPQVVVVTPVLNLSDSRDWDPATATDILAAEVEALDTLAVIPLNRVLATMHRLGRRTIETTEDALELAGELNADLVLVLALTEFDPYDPPRVGVTAQLFDVRARRSRGASIDAAALQRSGVEWRPAADGSVAGTGPDLQFQAIYDGAHAATLDDVQKYASERGGYRSPLEWRRHVQSQEAFLRYAIWASIRSMERERQYYRSDRRAAGETR